MGFGVEVGKDREEDVRHEGLRKRNLGKSGEYKKIWGNKALNMTEEWTYTPRSYLLARLAQE